MEHIKTYDEFLNEAIVVVKRKYTEAHPQRVVSNYAPVREKILSFVNEKGKVSEEELSIFLKMMNEETGGKTSASWVKANSKYFKLEKDSGIKYYTLSAEGKRIHEKITLHK